MAVIFSPPQWVNNQNVHRLHNKYIINVISITKSGENEWELRIQPNKPNDVLKILYHIDGFVQERRNSIANALELRLPCTTHRYSTML